MLALLDDPFLELVPRRIIVFKFQKIPLTRKNK